MKVVNKKALENTDIGQFLGSDSIILYDLQLHFK